jgi:hypothetical protein
MMDPAGAGCPRGADPASLRPLPGRREPAGSRRGGAPRGASIPERGGSGLHAGPGPRRRARPRVAHLVYLTLIGILLGLFLSYRSRLHHLQGRPRRGAIRLAQVEELDPIFAPDELGPTLEAEVLFLGSGSGVPAGTSDTEAWILSVLAKRAEVLFEFGTATGRTSYLWARNSPAHARVSTLTLPPEEHAAYRREWSDNRRAAQHALRESRPVPLPGDAGGGEDHPALRGQQGIRRDAVPPALRPHLRRRVARLLLRAERLGEGAPHGRARRDRPLARLLGGARARRPTSTGT